MNLRHKKYQVLLSNGEVWQIPVGIILDSMESHYGELELWMMHEDAVDDWAKNNMNWADVVEHAKLIKRTATYEDMWCNCEAAIVDE